MLRKPIESERETKKRIAEKLAQKRAQQIARRVLPPPRYDNVFFEGLAWLDELAGKEITGAGEGD